MRAVVAFVVVTPFALSACTLNSPYIDDYNAKLASHTLPFVAELNASTATALTTAPTENSASMTGTFFVPTTISNVDAIAGQIDMEANFASGTVSGRMTDFVEVQNSTSSTLVGTDMYGRVDFAGNIAVGTGSGDDISASGRGSMRATSGTTYRVTSTMTGDFYRRPSSELGAVGTVSLTADSGSSTETGNGVFYVTE